MTDRITIVPATLELAEAMAKIMRHEDSLEVVAQGFSPSEAMRVSVEGSLIAEAAIMPNGEVGAMWGAQVKSIVTDTAFMWMLGSHHVPKHRKVLLRGSRYFVERVQKMYPRLECCVDARYTQAVRWIEWMGFVRKGFYEGPTGVTIWYYLKE